MIYTPVPRRCAEDEVSYEDWLVRRLLNYLFAFAKAEVDEDEDEDVIVLWTWLLLLLLFVKEAEDLGSDESISLD